MIRDTPKGFWLGATRSKGPLLLLFIPLVVAGGLYSEYAIATVIVTAVVLIALLRPLWVVYLLLLLIPLDSFLPILTVPVLEVGATTANVLAVAAFAGCIIQVVRKQVKIRWSTSLTFFTLFVAWNFATIGWARFPRDAVTRSIEWLVFWGGYVALSTYLNDRRTLRVAMLFFGFGAWIVLVSGLVGFDVDATGRLIGLLGNPNSFGTVIVAGSLGVLLVPSFRADNTRTKWVLPTFYLALGLLAILLSGSRGSLIGWGLVVIGIGMWTRLSNGLAIVFFIAIAVIVSSEFAPQLYEPLMGRINSDESDTFGGRASVWLISSDLILSNPVRGYGSGSGSILVGEQFNAGSGLIGIQEKSAHSPILEVWIEAGLVGVSLYILAIIWPTAKIIWSILMSRRRQNLELRTSLGLFLAVFGGYLSVWIKNGGSTHDKQMFVFLTTGMALWMLGQVWINPLGLQEAESAVNRRLA